ncbi:hypothetical protein CAOG_06782 [Capsaspora owczarzaki ATCC 30864]|uniref:U1-type domain-containing protein n=1 Tax=Capsaspora owczarzaki (strain ATCC 30864) TaxID=595528 RepID=A0A0D2UN54_CAPO3|nr:hypothetical protein CAOG_06782 [Capsaspora owczarzaki ATCC 30864]KJE96456.1 hypothetical protein CAOG_006782 [Capsaspora owczarzaki ATCC 30864]|eukprot:XP_004344403.2 hypothetical protein CAOG_06782 [Capsaspora owczarzaki ATCC 30864]
MSSSNKPPSQVNDLDLAFRRTWDRAEYEQRMKDRQKSEEDRRWDSDDSDDDKPKALLKGREYKIDLTSKLGKSVVLTDKDAITGAGYYCKTCDCTLKDSLTYMDHINGRKHQRNLGMSMKVERSSNDQVKARLAALAKRKNEDYDDSRPKTGQVGAHVDKKGRQDDDKQDSKPASKPKAAAAAAAAAPPSQPEEEEDSGMDPELARMMGFSGFGSSKK